jgi:hypothetical protein
MRVEPGIPEIKCLRFPRKCALEIRLTFRGYTPRVGAFIEGDGGYCFPCVVGQVRYLRRHFSLPPQCGRAEMVWPITGAKSYVCETGKSIKAVELAVSQKGCWRKIAIFTNWRVFARRDNLLAHGYLACGWLGRSYTRDSQKRPEQSRWAVHTDTPNFWARARNGMLRCARSCLS